MDKERKLGIWLVTLFTGALVCIMVVMMRLGGGINLKEFISAGRVYDFSKKALTKSAAGWKYDEEQKGHRILRNRVVVKYTLDGDKRSWNHLYITVDEMSTPAITGDLYYYNKKNKKISEQAIQLVEGRNVIFLNPEISMYRMGIVLKDAKGEFLSISDMQIRNTLNWFTPLHFLKLFFVVYAAFVVFVICLISLFQRMKKKKYERYQEILEKIKRIVYVPVDILQYGYQLFGDYFGSRIGGRLAADRKYMIGRNIFILLLVWMVIGSKWNFSDDMEIYRYYVLVCVVSLMITAFSMWKKPLQLVEWKSPLMVSWLLLWGGVTISDFFVKKDLGSVGIVMLVTGGFFVFLFHNTRKSVEMKCVNRRKINILIGSLIAIILLYVWMEYLPETVQMIEDGELVTIWKNYIRRWNLLGNNGGEKIFRKNIPAYNGYVYMAYRYGIFILIPYIAYQFNLLVVAIKGTLKREYTGVLMLIIGVVYILLNICSNVEKAWGNPLWLSFYLLPCMEVTLGTPKYEQR